MYLAIVQQLMACWFENEMWTNCGFTH